MESHITMGKETERRDACANGTKQTWVGTLCWRTIVKELVRRVKEEELGHCQGRQELGKLEWRIRMLWVAVEDLANRKGQAGVSGGYFGPDGTMIAARETCIHCLK